jgi:HK97 family phage major capsid protein
VGLTQDLVERRGQLDNERKTLAQWWEEAGTNLDMDKVKSIEGNSVEKARKFKEQHDKINVLAAEVDAIADTVKAYNLGKEQEQALESLERMKHRGDLDANDDFQNNARQKSLGELFVESDAYTKKQGVHGPVSVLPGDVKTLMTTSAGWAPETNRTGRLVEFATRPVQVTDLIPMGRTGQAAVVYMEETTFTNNAAETAEAGTYPESALALTEKSSPVQKIATFLPVTDEQLEDVAGIQSYIDNRLTFMLRQRLDSQILVGNGTPPNLRGVLNVVGIQTISAGAQPVPDAAYKAMTLVRVTGRANPTGFVFNPTDWQDVKLLKTADGIYIWGNPADAAPDRLWGLPVALSDALTLNTALVGDWQGHSELVLRRDIEVQVSNSHSTFFIEGKQAIRADMRAALVFYRPTAFCTITSV